MTPIIINPTYATGFIGVKVPNDINVFLYTTDGSTPSESNESTKTFVKPKPGTTAVRPGVYTPDFAIEIEESWYQVGVTIKYCDAANPEVVDTIIVLAQMLFTSELHNTITDNQATNGNVTHDISELEP